MNNLSGENVKLKGQEVKGKLKPEFYEWFATYMVVKRAAIEPNFHALYLEMLDEIGEKLFEAILRCDLSQHQSFADERESKNEFRRALFVEESWFMARRINDRASAAGVDD